MRILPGPTKSNQALAWSPDGRWLVAGGSGDGLTVWDVDGNVAGRRILATGHGGKLMRFGRANGRLYVAFQSGGFWDWNPDTDEERLHPWAVAYHGFHGLAMNADGQSLVLSLRRETTRGMSNELVGFAIGPDGLTTEVWARPNRNKWHSETSLALRAGTDELFQLDAKGFVWAGAQSGKRVGLLALSPVGMSHWSLAPDGERVAWLSGHSLFVCGLERGAEPLTLPANEGEHRRGLAWSPDGRLISYTTGTTVRLLDSATLSEVRALDWNIGKPRAVAFNPDGLRAAVSGDGGRGWVTVFDLE